MSLFRNSRPVPPRPAPKFPSPIPSQRPSFIQKPVSQKPAFKPGLFEGGKKVPIWQLIREAKKGPVVIPKSGEKLYARREWAKRLTELMPHEKFKTHLDVYEAKRVLRQLRQEEAKTYKSDLKLKLNRERRVLEEKWGLKGKY